MLSDTFLIGCFIALMGLCLGSFYNVVILRGLSGESIVFPGSKCPNCGKHLKWYYNIPILSYVLLGGKCAFCKCKISIQYPLVELVTMGLFVASYLKWGLQSNFIFILAFFSLLLITAVTDILERVILTRHAYILLGLGLANALTVQLLKGIDIGIYSYYDGQNPLLVSVAGVFAGIVVMEILAYFGFLLAGKRAFGEGDTYVAGAMGAVFGWKYILEVLFAGFIIQFVISLPMFLVQMYKSGKKFAAIELVLFLILAGFMELYSSYAGEVTYKGGIVLLVIIAFHLVRTILKNVKTPSGCTYFPYVPALALAAFAGIFLWF